MEIVNYKSDYGIENKKDVAYVDSRYISYYFEKEHKNVLAQIRKIVSENSGYSEEFRRLNFKPSYYVNEQNKKQPIYLLTKKGFTALVMGFTGVKANRFKEMYIKRFEEMEQQIEMLKVARADYPLLTQNIKLLHGDSVRAYHYSNEINMINKIALGMSTKEFKVKNNITDKSIRPYLTEEQLYCIDKLQMLDSGLILGVTDYNQRKIILTNHYYTTLKGGGINNGNRKESE